jgi:MATE family multidrug resistance protein
MRVAALVTAQDGHQLEGARVTWKETWAQEGGGRELLRVALPLILSSSFLTLQLTIDRALLSQASSDTVAASIPAALLYWTPFTLLQNIAAYATTFVAQYTGAGRHRRVGPAVWQALYFSVAAGIAFLGLIPLADSLVALGGHSAVIQELEATYFRCLCFAALPALIVASANSFFSGRGETWIVLINDAVGLTVNAFLAYGLIFGHWGLPRWGIAGAGWATVAGSSMSAVVALALLFRRKYRAEYATTSCHFEPALFRRLMRFGFPNGLQWMLDGLAFTFFVFLVGRLGDVELAATNIAFAINMVGLLPMLGMGQAVGVLVGQRLGRDRPDIAARTTWTGFWLASIYIGTVAILYILIPEALYFFFRSAHDPHTEAVARLVPVLLCYAAVYSAFDCMNIVFSFALRGAGDTRFVTLVALSLAWPCMVLPTWAAWYYDWEGSLYWAWGFASLYISAEGVVFLGRFCAGKWKSMRVIEPVRVEETPTDGTADGSALAAADMTGEAIYSGEPGA